MGRHNFSNLQKHLFFLNNSMLPNYANIVHMNDTCIVYPRIMDIDIRTLMSTNSRRNLPLTVPLRPLLTSVHLQILLQLPQYSV